MTPRLTELGSSESLAAPRWLAPPEGCSSGKRWRFRRDLVIYLAHRRNGLSQRLLADVFDLPRSRIGTIIHEFDKFAAGAGSSHG